MHVGFALPSLALVTSPGLRGGVELCLSDSRHLSPWRGPCTSMELFCRTSVCLCAGAGTQVPAQQQLQQQQTQAASAPQQPGAGTSRMRPPGGQPGAGPGPPRLQQPQLCSQQLSPCSVPSLLPNAQPPPVQRSPCTQVGLA